MKKIIIALNQYDTGSTGSIMKNILTYAHDKADFDYFIMVPDATSKKNTFSFFRNSYIDKIDRHFIHRTIGYPEGFFDYRTTLHIIKKIKEISFNYSEIIIHCHNLHNCHIDLFQLFSFFSKFEKITKVVFTFHDSWFYTGGCYSYNFCNCYEWRCGCNCKCNQTQNKFFTPKDILNQKKASFSLIKEKSYVVCVSNWLNSELDSSIFKDFRRYVIYGETNIKPIKEKDIDLLDKLGIKNKKIVLTVSGYWNDWKGTSYIYKIAAKIPKNYIILVVGGKFDSKGYDNIIHVATVSQEELAHYYSIADVYMSTSQSETLGLTTCEAQICGIPIVAFGHAGIVETFTKKTGICVGKSNDINKMVDAIKTIVEKKPFKKSDLINNGKKFAKYSNCQKYLDIYNSKDDKNE